jgi:hypothetical protein
MNDLLDIRRDPSRLVCGEQRVGIATLFKFLNSA